MADLNVVSSEVIVPEDSLQRARPSAATIVAGDLVYLMAIGEYGLAQCDGTAEEAAPEGIAAHDAAVGQQLLIGDAGIITLGATASPSVGELYVLSTTPGKLMPEGDLISGNIVVFVAIGLTSDRALMRIVPSGEALP